jgi:ElaA protein
MPDLTSTVVWQLARFQDFSAAQLYAIFAAREAVFVVEQHCPYQELDGLDLEAHHLVGWVGDQVAAYLRILGPGSRFAEPSIGRVLTALDFRRQELGREAMMRAIDYMQTAYPGRDICISAQTYLENFYGSFGFRTVSEPYLEDDIPHIEMLRSAHQRR